MLEKQYLDDVIVQFKRLKAQGHKALAQTSDDHLFATLDPESNSIAIIVKHIAGNMRSRWTDFLTSDGEKPDRNRDGEFELAAADTRERLVALWEDGWERALNGVSSLTPADLSKTVSVRGEPHSVIQAINRQLTHYAAHVGQIVLLAKHYAGSDWQTLSIPRARRRPKT